MRNLIFTLSIALLYTVPVNGLEPNKDVATKAEVRAGADKSSDATAPRLEVISLGGSRVLAVTKETPRVKDKGEATVIAKYEGSPDKSRGGNYYGDPKKSGWFIASDQSDAAERRRVGRRADEIKAEVERLTQLRKRLSDEGKGAEAEAAMNELRFLRVRAEVENLHNFIAEHFEQQEKLQESVEQLRKEVDELKKRSKE